jgi:hypothetical protein
MRRELFSGLLALSIGVAGCASHSEPNASTTNPDNRLTSATVTFNTLQDGKDAKSGIDVQLLRGANELAADANSTGTDYKDNTTTPPIVLAIKGPFAKADAPAAQLRLRLTPDGNDTWAFNVRLALRYADETQQNYAWSAVRLDEKAPERTLVLAGAQQP